MRSIAIVRSLAAVAAGALVVGGCAQAESSYLRHASETRAAAAPAADAHKSPGLVLANFSSIVDKYGPAVVNISVTETAKTSAAVPSFPNANPNDPFWQFFRHFGPPVAPHGVPVAGLGSGFIISSDGLILTNAHVVDKAKDVTVKLTTGREYKAKVIGSDDHSDVALLKIDAHDLPTVKLGKSSDVRVGQWVVAIGSPYGFDNTVTSGIISAKGRSLGSDTYEPYLQTNAVVNPGSSGGPLFDLNGDVVGINSQIYSRSGGYQGLSFAIPIEVAVRVKDQLLQYGHVTYGRIGVTIQEVNQGLADSFGLKTPGGALVSSVDPDGPAAKAGILPGDVILQFNGKTVHESTSLPSMVADLKPGTQATMEVWRGGATRDVTVTVGTLGNNVVASAASPEHAHGKLGLEVRPLTPDERKEAGVRGGLVVNDASGPAADAGIQPGDVILRVNGTVVTNPAQLERLVAKAGKHVALLVERDNATLFVPVDLG